MAGLARGSELELHLLVVDQVGQVVRRCDQAVRLAVADVHPPLVQDNYSFADNNELK